MSSGGWDKSFAEIKTGIWQTRELSAPRASTIMYTFKLSTHTPDWAVERPKKKRCNSLCSVADFNEFIFALFLNYDSTAVILSFNNPENIFNDGRGLFCAEKKQAMRWWAEN